MLIPSVKAFMLQLSPTFTFPKFPNILCCFFFPYIATATNSLFKNMLYHHYFSMHFPRHHFSSLSFSSKKQPSFRTSTKKRILSLYKSLPDLYMQSLMVIIIAYRWCTHAYFVESFTFFLSLLSSGWNGEDLPISVVFPPISFISYSIHNPCLSVGRALPKSYITHSYPQYISSLPLYIIPTINMWWRCFFSLHLHNNTIILRT